MYVLLILGNILTREQAHVERLLGAKLGRLRVKRSAQRAISMAM